VEEGRATGPLLMPLPSRRASHGSGCDRGSSGNGGSRAAHAARQRPLRRRQAGPDAAGLHCRPAVQRPRAEPQVRLLAQRSGGRPYDDWRRRLLPRRASPGHVHGEGHRTTRPAQARARDRSRASRALRSRQLLPRYGNPLIDRFSTPAAARVVLAVALFAAVVIATTASAAQTRTGLYGKVTKGPLRPVCREDQPCEGPAPNTVLVFSRNGDDVARTTTRSDGSYRIRLRPGRHAVRVGGRALVRKPIPSSVRVPQNGFKRVDFFVDTGIQ
jgi:hypothetical protein